MNLNATLIFEVISFLILVAILAKYAYRPLLKFLDERSGQVKATLEEAEKKKIEAEKKLSLSQKELDWARGQALAIQESAKRQSEELGEKILGEAEKKASSLITQSRKDILQETQQAKINLRTFIAGVSVSIASKILKREINEKDDSRIIEEGIKDLKNLKQDEY